MLDCRNTPGPCPAFFAGRPEWCRCRAEADRVAQRHRKVAAAKAWTLATLVALPLAAGIVKLMDMIL